MRFLLALLAVLALFAGIGILVNAKSAIHEIEALVIFLTSAVLLSGAGIIDTLVRQGSLVSAKETTPKKIIEQVPTW